MRTSFLALFALLPALQAAAPPPAETQTFEDWTLRCVAGAAPPCEMLQVAQNKDRKRVMSIAIAYLPRRDQYVLQLSTPLGVAFAKGARLRASGFNSRPMPYQRCDGNGCYVQGAIQSGALDALGRSAAQAKIIIAGVAGREIDLPLSLRGFSAARAAMESRARDKTAAAPPAAAKSVRH